jgi:hypothetical protein
MGDVGFLQRHDGSALGPRAIASPFNRL